MRISEQIGGLSRKNRAIVNGIRLIDIAATYSFLLSLVKSRQHGIIISKDGLWDGNSEEVIAMIRYKVFYFKNLRTLHKDDESFD